MRAKGAKVTGLDQRPAPKAARPEGPVPAKDVIYERLRTTGQLKGGGAARQHLACAPLAQAGATVGPKVPRSQVPSSHAAMQQQAKARQVRIRVPGHDEDLFPGGLWPDCVAHLLPVGADHGRRNKLRQQSGSPPQRKKLRSSLPPTRPPPRRSKGALDT